MSKYKDDPKDYWKISSDYCKVDNQLAAKIGLNEAIVLRTLYELCRSKKQTDNISWWQGKQQYWLIKFPWLSERTLFRVFERLEKLGLIEIRIDKKTGNHYRPVQKQIERILNDDDFQLGQNEAIQSSQNGGTTDNQFCQTGGEFRQNGGESCQNGGTLLSLGSVSLSGSLSSVPTASAVEVFEGQKTVDKVRIASKEQTGGSLIFEAYALAYSNKYGFEPTRGKEANRWAKKIYEEVGIDEGCSLVQHYVQMNKAWFIQKGHSLEWCFRDLTEVRRSFHTGITMTSSQIKHIENRQTAKETADEVQQSNGELASAWARIDTKRELKI
jgi:hypothetical protein